MIKTEEKPGLHLLETRMCERYDDIISESGHEGIPSCSECKVPWWSCTKNHIAEIREQIFDLIKKQEKTIKILQDFIQSHGLTCPVID